MGHHGTHRKAKNRVARTRPNNIRNRLTYCPNTDKNRFTRNLRATLQAMPSVAVPDNAPVNTTIEVGAINIDGLDLETSWALSQIVDKYKLKVKKISFDPFIGNPAQT